MKKTLLIALILQAAPVCAQYHFNCYLGANLASGINSSYKNTTVSPHLRPGYSCGIHVEHQLFKQHNHYFATGLGLVNLRAKAEIRTEYHAYIAGKGSLLVSTSQGTRQINNTYVSLPILWRISLNKSHTWWLVTGPQILFKIASKTYETGTSVTYYKMYYTPNDGYKYILLTNPRTTFYESKPVVYGALQFLIGLDCRYWDRFSLGARAYFTYPDSGELATPTRCVLEFTTGWFIARPID